MYVRSYCSAMISTLNGVLVVGGWDVGIGMSTFCVISLGVCVGSVLGV